MIRVLPFMNVSYLWDVLGSILFLGVSASGNGIVKTTMIPRNCDFAIFTWLNQIPNEISDLLVSFVMAQTEQNLKYTNNKYISFPTSRLLRYVFFRGQIISVLFELSESPNNVDFLGISMAGHHGMYSLIYY